MKKRHYNILALLLLLFGTNAMAQTSQQYLDRAEECYKNRRYDDAITNALRVIEKLPRNTRANELCAFSYDKIGYLSETIRYHNRLERFTAHKSVYSNLGKTYVRIGYYDEAMANINKALELDPDYRSAIINRGMLYGTFSRIDEA